MAILKYISFTAYQF